MESNLTSDANANFPTAGLKSLLQSSDLLEILLKPMSKGNDASDVSPLENSESEHSNSASSLNGISPDLSVNNHDLDLLIDVSKKAKAANGENEAANTYGDPYLGPNLWSKDDLFQGGVEFEHLEVDEFLKDLNEGGLNEADVEFLQKINISNSTNNSASVNMSSSLTIAPPTQLASSPIPTQQPHQSILYTEPKANPLYGDALSESASRHKSSINDSNLDLSIDSNDYSSNEFDDFDPRVKKLSDDDLRPQPILRKSKKQHVPAEMKDEKYWDRRRKNNVAAKRSRDARRVKENQIAIRASYLERENDALRKQLEDSRRETKSLKNKIEKYEMVHPDLKHLDEHI